MALVAKRKVTQTWRDAVAGRAAAFGVEAACIAAFDSAVADGEAEHAAAFAALRTWNCLFEVSLPGDPADAEADMIEPEGS